MDLKATIQEDMKQAMRDKQQDKLNAIRLILAAIKQQEVDERIQVTDQQVLAILDKMTKQRRESITQYEGAGRQDLADKEKFELAIIQHYLPAQLTEEEIQQLLKAAITEAGAKGMQDMGKVMNIVRPKAQGRADMSALSQQIKALLQST